jgi:hypothetical protein
MTDRELLEAAAKAAGIDGEYRTEHLCVGGDWLDVTAIFLADDAGWWNPLLDDGDALRLAVKLGIACSVRRGNACATYEGPHGFFVPMDEPVRDDPCAAARRAIVRAAAAMSKEPR